MVVFPSSTQEVAEVGRIKIYISIIIIINNDTSSFRFCQVCKVCTSHKTPIIPYGTGTGLEGGVAALHVTFTSSSSSSSSSSVSSPSFFTTPSQRLPSSGWSLCQRSSQYGKGDFKSSILCHQLKLSSSSSSTLQHGQGGRRLRGRFRCCGGAWGGQGGPQR